MIKNIKVKPEPVKALPEPDKQEALKLHPNSTGE